jgi:hypothetical protein
MSIPYQTTGPASFSLKQINNNAETRAYMGMPFKPATMTQGSDFAMGRHEYIKDSGNPKIGENVVSGRSYGNSKKKFNNSSGEQTNKRKMIAIGKSSINKSSINKNNNNLMAFSAADNTTVNSALNKCRGGGCVAPKKKGAV